MKFKIVSDYKPSGDQPEAIKGLCSALNNGIDAVTLLGVTGSGKTFTMANVIERLQRPALILSHNKTLAAQLYGEFKSFFPNNAVEYFVSYYDYYQPEAYIPTTDTYIEKDLSINDEIEKLRLSAASSLLSGRRDVIVISSVSCLYGIGNPEDFHSQTVFVKKGETRSMTKLLYQLVDALYSRTEAEFKRGSFRVRGDTVDICLGNGDNAVRIEFFGDEVDNISVIDPVTGAFMDSLEEVAIYPANNFVTTRERSIKAISDIQDDLVKQCAYFEEIGKNLEAKRLKQRVEYDLEMIKELGYCPGIENYSRYFDGRKEGMRPFCLIDYFPKDFITFIDESHVTLPQIRAMYGGDHSRKSVLVEYGFRLPAAADNRPLKFEEFEAITGQTVYVSATPGDYELEKSGGLVVEQVVRPTGLLDPPIQVRPTENQVDDLPAAQDCIGMYNPSDMFFPVQALRLVHQTACDEEKIWNAVQTVAEKAVACFVAMRATEGEKLRADILSKADTILEHVSFVESRSPQTVRDYNEKLRQRMEELLENTQIDEQRLLTEAAIFADKVAVDEETVRLRSHISQLREFMDADEPIGRKLDFLVQEINREANTIGSKAQDVEIAKRVIAIKAEVEKIREQVQNTE